MKYTLNIERGKHKEVYEAIFYEASTRKFTRHFLVSEPRYVQIYQDSRQSAMHYDPKIAVACASLDAPRLLTPYYLLAIGWLSFG